MAIWRQQAPDSDLLPALKRWFEGPVGRQLLKEEKQLLQDSLKGVFGRSMLELSLVTQTLASRPDGIHRHYSIGPAVQRDLGRALDAVADFTQLPIANESQDAVVLHHLLEFVANPHNMLREIERITVPHGRVLIVGFNPFSLLGLQLQFRGRLQRNSVWQQHVLTTYRLIDWLHLLGFEVNHCWYGFHRLPLSKPAWCMRHRWPAPELIKKLPVGGSFVLSATKYRAPVTPIKMKWRRETMVNVRPLGAAREGCLNSTQSESQ